MSSQVTDNTDIAIWDPPIYSAIELSHFQNERGLVVYEPGCFNGQAYVQSDCFVDTYDVR